MADQPELIYVAAAIVDVFDDFFRALNKISEAV